MQFKRPQKRKASFKKIKQKYLGTKALESKNPWLQGEERPLYGHMWAVLEEDIANSEVTFLLFLHNRPPRNNADVISFSTIKVFRELPRRE